VVICAVAFQNLIRNEFIGDFEDLAIACLPDSADKQSGIGRPK
jgi:hypothetical protein